MYWIRFHRRHFALFFVLLMLSFIPLELAGTAKSSSYGQSDYSQLVVRFKEPISSKQIQAITDHGGQIIDRNDFLNSVLVKVPKEAVSLFINGLQQGNLVDYVEQNTVNEMEYVPNDANWSLQWNMPTIKANATWDITTGSNSVIVAVIDSGVDYNHPDLASNYLPGGYDWADNDTDPSAYDNHGTFCAGIIAAVTNNTIGVAGVAQVKILSEKIFGYGANNGTDWALAQRSSTPQISAQKSSAAVSLAPTRKQNTMQSNMPTITES